MNGRRRHTSVQRPRGSVTLVVLWAVAIASIVVAATQVLAWRQAVMGREALARVQARWAARAGVESMISIMEYYQKNPVSDDALALTRDLEAHAIGSTETGEFDIRHFRDGFEYAGPMDEHSKLNINIATKPQLLTIPNMTPDVVDAIIDWRDANNEVEGFGAEAEYYANRGYKYRPRNDNFRSIAELELVAGCWPRYVRGEDWNLNSRLDPNENDGSLSMPDDKPDGYLDAGWSGYLTAYSRGSHATANGVPKLFLRTATTQQIEERLGVDSAQASALLNFSRQGNARLETLLVTPLNALAPAGGAGGGRTAGTTGRSRAGGRQGSQPAQQQQEVAPLDSNQLRLLFAECTLDDPFKPAPGRVNLNTVSSEVLQRGLGLEPRAAEAIISARQRRQGGFTSIVDLLEIADLKPETITQIAGQVGVESFVYLISSRGRALSTGTEVELVVVVDRSTIPLSFIEVREP
ncbi:MAG: general secretion pathway protein GspK [Phycisphaeraceae bacterium]|nr:general secretion pathway protein GspK [Phycisphaeraceae bacterium]